MILAWLVRCRILDKPMAKKQQLGWVLISSHWDALRKVVCKFLGESPKGRLVRLTSRGGGFIPTQGGVYMLCAYPPKCDLPVMKPPQKAERHLYNALYIGEADNLQRRYQNYARGNNISSDKVRDLLRTYDRVDFCYWTMPSGVGAKGRKTVQNIMIECFGPTANTQGGGRTLSGYLQPPIQA